MAAEYVTVEKLVEVIGLTMALRLCSAFGGRRIYLAHPSRVLPHSDAAKVLGLATAQQLAASWPQTHIEIPRAADYLRRERDRRIHAERASTSERDLAAKYDTTERNIRLIMVRPAPAEDAARVADERQLGLF